MVKLRSMSVAIPYGGGKYHTSEPFGESSVKGYSTVKKSGPVAYDSSNWCQIMFQCFGSTWPKVLPFCLLNTLSMLIFTLLRDRGVVDCSISGQAHSYGIVVLSFLLVSRINTALARYNESRGFIGTMYQETREIIQYGLCLSTHYGNTNEESREWRNELAYRGMILLRTAVAVVEFCSRGIPAWQVPELTGAEKMYVTPNETWHRHHQRTTTPSDADSAAHDYINSMRVPFRAAFLLRETIISCEKRLPSPFHITQINSMLGSVDRLLSGFYGIRKFITTPVPFPLIQMTRTILCFYLFTIPMIFLKDSFADNLLERCLSVFLLTYGFMGLELVAIELDDPFGTDDNDFDCLAFANMVFEDSFLIMHDVDGEQWAYNLRHRMNRAVEEEVSSSIDEKTSLLNRTDMILKEGTSFRTDSSVV